MATQTMELRKHRNEAGLSAVVTVDGDSATLHVPALTSGRAIGIRVVPESGHTITLEDSLSQDKSIRDGSAIWDYVKTGAVYDGVFSEKTSITYMCPISGLKITGTGTVEVLV